MVKDGGSMGGEGGAASVNILYVEVCRLGDVIDMGSE